MTDKAENKSKLSQEGLTLVLMRNDFYRDNYRRAVVVLVITFFVNIILGAAVVDRYINPPQPQYFPTNAQYQLIKYHPLSDPVVSNNFVLQFVSNAVQKAFSLDFIHWRAQLQEASSYFTASGWYWFLAAFKQSGDLDSLVKLNMVSDAEITGAPVVQYQNVLGGRYVWRVEIPVMISYRNVAKVIHQPLKIIVIVERVPVQENAYRIAINQFLPKVQSQ